MTFIWSKDWTLKSLLTILWCLYPDTSAVTPVLAGEWTTQDTQVVVSGWPQSSQLD